MKEIKIAINGFGRIGRLFFRQIFRREPELYKGLKIIAINDLGNIENLAYLLKYDSVYGRYDKSVRVSGDKLLVDDKEIKVFQIKE
ncbi:MAG: type I glyceraldehyde-3-phosphate dehydrogenase, partial [Patescibacteria group bacterium]|nr:type I glyceraldehyde-3-phosphate dehydrogenase [Patescibacteria group bacterium]MDW8280050.1 glyceraldehyde 3-phosphate dehydrogenase NAD-binding domain-containing protein [bacterium]